MCLKKILSIIIVTILFMSGCLSHLPEIDDHIALASIVKRGFAKNKRDIINYEGKEIQIWGYPDHYNISPGEGIIEKQPLYWDIPINDGYPFFSLRARSGDEVGESVRVRIIGNIEQYKEVFMELRDAGISDSQIIVLVRGVLRTFEAPTNTGLSTGVYIDVDKPGNIAFQ